MNVDKIRLNVSSTGRSLRKFIPVASIGMLLVLGGWYGAAGLSIGTASYTAAPHTSTVYIVETPVTWNYSPQNITVVIGVNNTVTWVSKSISYDTITSANGLFDSGTSAQGQPLVHLRRPRRLQLRLRLPSVDGGRSQSSRPDTA